MLLGAISIAFLIGMASCGGGSAPSSQTRSVVQSGTPPGTYSIMVVANSGGLSHSAQLTLTVQ